MINFDIAAYTRTDQSELEKFFRESWSVGKFPFRPEDKHSDLRNIPSIYQLGRGDFWVMRVSGSVVGTVAIKNLHDNVAEVKRLNVHPKFLGLGLGSALFEHALEYAEKAGFKAVRLDSIRSPGPALHLYEKHGFSEIPRYNDNPNADIFMELVLNQTHNA